MKMDNLNPKSQKNLQILLANQTPEQRNNLNNSLNLSNVIKRPSKCRLCDGHGKIYRNDIGARGIEYFYLEECDRCYGKGFEPN
jgi:DnaJ-class molecular chaperone